MKPENDQPHDIAPEPNEIPVGATNVPVFLDHDKADDELPTTERAPARRWLDLTQRIRN